MTYPEFVRSYGQLWHENPQIRKESDVSNVRVRRAGVSIHNTALRAMLAGGVGAPCRSVLCRVR